MSRRAGVELETSGQEGVRDKSVLPRRRRPFHFCLPTHGFAGGLFLPTCIEFDLRLGVISARAAKAVGSDPIGFTSRMHFGYYLMIAALVLMGLEVLYALYQLATFL
jgi:hypothetical protein